MDTPLAYDQIQATSMMHSAYTRLLLCHRKVEFILVSFGSLLLEAGQAVLLGVIVTGTFGIIFVFLKKPEFFAVCQLTTLFVVASVQ